MSKTRQVESGTHQVNKEKHHIKSEHVMSHQEYVRISEDMFVKIMKKGVTNKQGGGQIYPDPPDAHVCFRSLIKSYNYYFRIF